MKHSTASCSGAALLPMLLVACSPVDDARDPGPFRAENFANAVDPKDVRAEGQHYFLHETWGAERNNSWPPYRFLMEVMGNEIDVFGDQFTEFGTLTDPLDTLPVGLKRGALDRERVHETCAFCHTSRLPDGRLWIGAPNNRLDFGGLKVALHQRWTDAGYEPYLSALELEKLASLGPGRTDASSSDYPRAVPADFPPYFRLGDKTALNHLGTGGDLRSEVAMALYAFGAGGLDRGPNGALPFPSADKMEAFLRFLRAIEPPELQESLPSMSVARGAEIFEQQRCSDCHVLNDVAALGVVTHVEGPEELLPGDDAAFERGTIATSVAHRVLIDGDSELEETAEEEAGGGADSGRLPLILFIVTGGYAVGSTDGYRVPDLAGVWATAPYLHNGSVPSLEALLEPPGERPANFNQGGSDFDTAVWGNHNVGHNFGTGLNGSDRAALITFLRSL